MRIYTNFDIWNMSKRNIKLGKAIYNNQIRNLDDLSQASKLINNLIKDNVIKSSDTKKLDIKPSNLHESHFKFILPELKMYNSKQDQSPNNMQYLTVFANLKQTPLLQEIS